MKDIMRSAMEHGALGVSFGLIYVPGCYAKTDELIEIAKIVGQYHGVAAIHLRNEGDNLVPAVEEFIEIVRQSGVRGVISHHKVVGFTNRGAVNTTLKMLEEANAPIVHKNQLVVLIEDFPSESKCYVNVMKVSKYIDIHCSTVARLEVLTEEEVQEWEKEYKTWKKMNF